MDDKDIRNNIKAVMSGEGQNPFYSDSRWSNLYSYADTLKDLIASGNPPSEEIVMTLSLILEQFPESPPVDEESFHVLCVHHLVKTVLGGLRKEKIEELGRNAPKT